MIKELGLATLLLTSSCKTLVPEPFIPETFEEQYGELLMIKQKSNILYLSYDRDGDEIEDLRLAYEVIGIDEKGIVYLKLRGIADDKDRNGIYEDDEIRDVYKERKDLI